jgi:hypothetical protein
MSKVSLHDPFGHLNHKLWPKEGSRVKFDSWPLKIKNRPISLRVGDVTHAIEKLLTRVTSLLQTSSRSELCTQSYGPPKLWESQPWEFQDSHLGVPGQNVIWVMVLWPSTKYTIRGKVVPSPKSRSWWVLWVCVCPWLVRAPKMPKIHTNQLVVWFVQVRVSNWCLSFFLVPIPKL